MSLFALDTDHLSLYQVGHPQVLRNVARHVQHTLAITVISAEEQFAGWQHALRRARDNTRREHVYRRLADMAEGLAVWLVLPFPMIAIQRHEQLIRARLNVGSFDLKIAAIAVENQATVVTRNRRDFAKIPRLSIVDRSV